MLLQGERKKKYNQREFLSYNSMPLVFYSLLKRSVGSHLWKKTILIKIFLQTLLNIFTGVKLHLPESVQEFEKLRRYFVAYDGDLVPDYDAASATHTLADPEEGSQAQKVSSNWIWQCVRKRRVVPPCWRTELPWWGSVLLLETFLLV